MTFPDEVVEGALGPRRRLPGDGATGRRNDPVTIRRDGDTPKVEITDPLARHDRCSRCYTNENVQDVTAFLATLK